MCPHSCTRWRQIWIHRTPFVNWYRKVVWRCCYDRCGTTVDRASIGCHRCKVTVSVSMRCFGVCWRVSRTLRYSRSRCSTGSWDLRHLPFVTLWYFLRERSLPRKGHNGTMGSYMHVGRYMLGRRISWVRHRWHRRLLRQQRTATWIMSTKTLWTVHSPTIEIIGRWGRKE